jgi:hypothetical protein
MVPLRIIDVSRNIIGVHLDGMSYTVVYTSIPFDNCALLI